MKNVSDSLESDHIIIPDSLKFVEPQLDASFPGGPDSLLRFIKRNLKYPKEDIEGKVYVRFLINEDGSVHDFEVAKGLCYECDKNAIEALRKMPRWKPSKINGRPVKQKMIVPVVFEI